MKQLLRSTLILFIVGFLSSCNKDDEAPVTKSQTISGKKWISTALTINPGVQFEEGGPVITDLYAFYQNAGRTCINDDIKVFNLNGTYTFEEGASKCQPTNPQVYESGTWLFSSDESALVTNTGGNTINYDILTLDATSLVWRYVIPTRDGPVYVLQETLTLVND